ncbi:MAG: O-antigen ligase family protein [Chitinophagaceae bacterium]|nr:O-antigen ligase family protein [Chitinophagaceae bacterium]MCW5927413.1 O-antigen ligase family protein [Chitinophagaceae bacterium]
MKSVFNQSLPGRLFVLFSFIIVPFGSSGILFRLAFPDIILAIAIVLLFGSRKIYNPKIGIAMLLLLFLLTTAILSLNPINTLGEVSILLFLVFATIVLYNTYYFNLKLLFLDISVAVTMAFIIGIYDFFAGNIGLPRLFPGRAPGEIVSTFRNAGQAGAYVLIMLAILLPIRLTDLKNSFTSKEMRKINLGIITGVAFLLLSGKIAAYFGFFAGILFLNVVLRNVKAIALTVILGLFIGIIYLNLEDISPALNTRIQMKIQSRVTSNINKGKDVTEEGFIAENIKSSIHAFEDNPLSGSGIGAFEIKYGSHEVHSTYFKMLGEGGVLGVIGYVFFFIYIIRLIRFTPSFTQTVFQLQLLQYKKVFMPFFWGCAISWAYTYHLRKREFWIMLSVILIINSFLKNAEKADRRSIETQYQ